MPPSKQKTKSLIQKTPSIRFSIAGVQYSDYNKVESQLKPGVSLTLKREPSNRFDSKAIAILYKGVRIGYVPKGESQNILYGWRDKLNCSEIDVTLVTVNKNNPTWGMYTVECVGCYLVANNAVSKYVDFNRIVDDPTAWPDDF